MQKLNSFNHIKYMKEIKKIDLEQSIHNVSKGSVSNPYTIDEFLRNVERKDWAGGYVESLGFVDSTLGTGHTGELYSYSSNFYVDKIALDSAEGNYKNSNARWRQTLMYVI